ncbi:MAG: alkaline phosphatase family protein [Chloroflexota bacterium]
MSQRIFVLALDGATFDLIKPWAQAGHLPALARLLEQGAHGPLASTLPPVTSPAWPSFMTGVNPGKHGVFDFIEARAGSFNVVNATSIRSPSLWELLSAAGRRVGVLNVPVTYPPPPVNGFLVAGLLAPPGREIAYPPGFLARYEAELGPYRVTPGVQHKLGNEDVFIADLENLMEQRTRYALRLMQAEAWDFFMVHYLALDVAQHALWWAMDATHPRHDAESATRYGNAIRHLYQRADAALGQYLDQLPDDTTVVVMSDHGFGPLHWVVNLNLLLLEAGLLHLKRNPWVQLKAALFRRGLTPAAVYRQLARFGLQNVVWRVSRQVRNKIVDSFLSFEDVDWSRTQAYSMGHVGQIYVNVRGREPQGMVEPGEVEEVLQRVVTALESLRDPDSGRPLLERVVRGSEAAHGPYAGRAPDLHVVLDNYRCIAFPLFAADGRIVTRQIRGDSGSHRREGILLVWGPGVPAGATIQGARIEDVAPTILHLLGLPVPEYMDGRPLDVVGGSPLVASPAMEYETAATDYQPLSAEEEAAVQARLRGLGYLG